MIKLSQLPRADRLREYLQHLKSGMAEIRREGYSGHLSVGNHPDAGHRRLISMTDDEVLMLLNRKITDTVGELRDLGVDCSEALD